MKRSQNPCRSTSRTVRSRGTVIMLVVAIMTLLMIIGTVFIFSTRMERASARSTSDSVNFDLARNASLDIIRDRLFNQTAFPTGVTAAVSANMSAVPAGTLLVRPPFWSHGINYAENDVVMGSDFRLYKVKVAKAHTSDMYDTTNMFNPPPANTDKWQAYTGIPVSASFAEFRDVPSAAGWTMPLFNNSTSNPGWPSNVYLTADLTAPGVTAVAGDYSIITGKRFNPKTGAYDINYGGTPPLSSDISAVYGDVPTSIYTADGIWQLLTFSSGTTRYRVAWRVVDTSRMLNLNIGNYGAPNMFDRNGTYLTGPLLSHTSVFNGSDAANVGRLHGGYQSGGVTLRGRAGYSASPTFSYQGWQDLALGYEKNGLNPAASTSAVAEWFDITDELELRANGPFGTTYAPRTTGVNITAPTDQRIWYNTLRNNFSSPGNPNRNFFTTHSWERNIGPIVNPKYKLTTPTAQVYNWPGGTGSNRQVNLTAKSSVPDDIARNAIYLANAMAFAGYTDDECMQAAVNYCGQAGDSRSSPPVIVKGSGLVIMVGPNAYPYPIATNAGSNPPAKTYLAYYGQPYLNEVAVQRTAPNTDMAEPVTDYVVELVNPHQGSIDLKDWRIKIGNNVWISDLGTTLANGGPVTPMAARSFSSIATTRAFFTTASSVQAAGFDPSVENTITLERPYYVDSTSTKYYMVVDQITGIAFPQPGAYTFNPGTDRTFDKQRNNTASGFSTPTKTAVGPLIADHDWWMCTSDVTYSDETHVQGDPAGPAAVTPSINAANPVSGDSVRFGVEMMDRFSDGTTPVTGSALMRENVGDLSGYMLIGHRNDSTVSTPATANTTICNILNDNTTYKFPSVETSNQLKQEAKVRYHFLRDPRAQALLSTLTSVDRASDTVDQIGAGSADSIDETRIPGRVNINTAPMEVLRAVLDNYYTNSAGTCDTTKSIAACNAIIDYRKRANNVYNFSNAAVYPGTGFKNVGELVIPLSVADGSINILDKTVTGSTISLDRLYNPAFFRRQGAPDTITASWTKLFTVCTVRSDTFAVYGYLEAIQPHPTVTHNNNSDWYGATSDTPASGGPNLRIGFRRFVAIIDRSWCNVPRSNGNFQLPRIVGVRELPK